MTVGFFVSLNFSVSPIFSVCPDLSVCVDISVCSDFCLPPSKSVDLKVNLQRFLCLPQLLCFDVSQSFCVQIRLQLLGCYSVPLPTTQLTLTLTPRLSLMHLGSLKNYVIEAVS